MLFRDRFDAARQLAAKLSSWHDHHVLILAIPKGAVPMGKIIADELEGELNIVLAHKLQTPHYKECAMGAVDESGWVYMNEHVEHLLSNNPQYLRVEVAKQLAALHQKRMQYTGIIQPAYPKGRIVIVVDDGLATGATMIAALHYIREQQPERLICAIPVASQESIEAVKPFADEVVCLYTPPGFSSIGEFYSNFHEVTNEEVTEILRHAY